MSDDARGLLMEGQDSDGGEDGGASDMKAARAQSILRKEQGKAISKLRRQALIKGMQATTSGIAQDMVYALLDAVSQFLVIGQLYINLKSLFGGEGCNASKGVKAETIWFYSQLILNALVTIAQFCLWFYGFYLSGGFFCSYWRCPTSKDAQSADDYEMILREIHVRSEGEVDLDGIDDEEKKADVLNDVELEPQELAEFKKQLVALGKVNSLQGTLTSARAVIGSLGAMIEPGLAAFSALSSKNPEQLAMMAASAAKNATVSVNASKTALAVKLSEASAAGTVQLEALKTCLAARQVSACASGIIAAVGLKQAMMKAKYTRLVVLNQLREEDIQRVQRERANGRDGKRKLTDAAIEMELNDILGESGKRYMSYLSGRQGVAE